MTYRVTLSDGFTQYTYESSSRLGSKQNYADAERKNTHRSLDIIMIETMTTDSMGFMIPGRSIAHYENGRRV